MSSVDFRAESSCQSIDYCVSDLLEDEGVMNNMDIKSSVSKNDLSALTVDFDISSQSLELITPSFSQAITPIFDESHPSFDQMVSGEDGVRDSISTMSVLHSTIESCVSTWTGIENLARTTESGSHKSFQAIVLQSSDMDRLTQSRQSSIVTDDTMNLGKQNIFMIKKKIIVCTYVQIIIISTIIIS